MWLVWNLRSVPTPARAKHQLLHDVATIQDTVHGLHFYTFDMINEAADINLHRLRALRFTNLQENFRAAPKVSKPASQDSKGIDWRGLTNE